MSRALSVMGIRSAHQARLIVAPLLRLFVTGLGRPPSPAELAPLVERSRAGDDIGYAAVALAGGAEFLARHGPEGVPDGNYLRSLFWAIDGQDPSEPESAALLGQPNVTRASLLAQASQCARAEAAITLIRHYYGGILRPDDEVAYQLWLENGGEAPPEDIGPAQPHVVSIVIHTSGVRPDLLARSLAMLQAQTSAAWEAVILADAKPAMPSRPPVAADGRVLWVDGDKFPAALTKATQAAGGDFIGYIEAGDELAPDAVAAAVRLIGQHPGLRLLFTDEDRVCADGTRSAPILKTGWSPDLLLSGDVFGQLTLFDRRAVLAEGGFRHGLADHGRFELALRLTRNGMAAHLPGIMFHRGRGPGSRPPLFPQARVGNGMAHLDAIVDGFLAEHRPGLTRSSRRHGAEVWPAFTAALPDPAPLVSVIVLTKDKPDLLRPVIEGLLAATDYPALEVILVDNGTTDPAALALLAAAEQDARVRLLRCPGEVSWSALNNAAASQAAGQVLLLNNDATVLQPNWLRKMAGQAIRPGVGVVGAKLLFPDGRLQQGGLLLGPGGAAAHAMTGAGQDDPGYLAQAMLLRDLSAVTGACLAIRADVFRQVGGLKQDMLQVGWGDIDLCLRVREAGYRVLWDPDVVLVHQEQATPGCDAPFAQQARHELERRIMRRRWPDAMDRDPFRNPALRAAPCAMLLGVDGPSTDAATGSALGHFDRVDAELQLEMARLRHEAATAKALAANLRDAWPRAELQHLRRELADLDAALKQHQARAGLWASSGCGDISPGVLRTYARWSRAGGGCWRLLRRLAGIVRRARQRLRLLRQRRADYAVIEASPVFGRAWYREHAMAGDKATDPVAHYLWVGGPAGHGPHPLFDSAWYAARTEGIGMETPFAHYLRRGMAADADPHPLFVTEYYLAQAPEAAGRALEHFDGLRAGDTRCPAPLFDPASCEMGLARWARAGASQGCDPHASFAAAWYKQAHLGGDTSADPLAHWIRQGAASGLATNPYGISQPTPAKLPVWDGGIVATIIVTPGDSALDTNRTILSIAANSAPVAFEVILIGPVRRTPYPEQIGTAPDVAAAARAAKGGNLVFLGPGAVVHPGWLDAAVGSLSNGPAIGIVGCKTLTPGGRLRSVGASVSRDGHVCRYGAGDDPALAQYNTACPADAVDPSAMLVCRAAWDAAGGFDDRYGSDTMAAADLSANARSLGWGVIVQPASLVTVSRDGTVPDESDRLRFCQRWAGRLPLRAASAGSRRILVLVDAVPASDQSPEAEALGWLSHQGASAMVCTRGQACASPACDAWRQRGVGIITAGHDLDAWLEANGAMLDEVWSFMEPLCVPHAELRRWTGAPLLQSTADGAVPPWCDGELSGRLFDVPNTQ